MDIHEESLYAVQASMEQWTDHRVIPAPDLESLLLFLQYGHKVFSQSGLVLKGFSCRQKNGQTLLTVKVTQESIPLVVFVTSSSTTSCITRLLNLFEDDRLTWRKDKYPWI